MAAAVERMFYYGKDENGNRFVPWHGLGTCVEEALNSDEALKAAGLDWDVLSKPIYDGNGNEIKGYKANTRSSDNKVLGVVTNKYTVVQNTQAFKFTDDIIGTGNVKYVTAGSLNGGKRVWMLAQMPRTTILGDEVDPYMCFTNTHDGTGAVKVMMTPIRVVCNNTLNLAISGAKRRWSTKHMGEMDGKLRDAQETLGLAEKYMKELDKKAEQMANTKVSNDQFASIITTLFPVSEEDSDTKKRNAKKAKDDFMAVYFAPDIQKFLGTQWGVVNAAADFVGHVAPARMTSTYAENNFGKIIDGRTIMDQVVELLGVNA